MAAEGQQVREARLLERERELHAIRSAIADARSGQGRIVLIDADPGTGKTSLVQAGRRLAADAGFEILTARGTPIEVEYPYGVVRQLFEPVAARRAGELLVGPAAPARAVLLGSPEPRGGGQDIEFALRHALYWLVVALAERRPLMLIVDDTHWVDRASAGFLRFLVARLEELALTLVIATRPRVDEQETGSLADLEDDPRVTVLRPAPLSETATRSLIAETLGEPADAFVAACHKATGGNPFFLGELMRVLARESVAPRAERAPDVATVGPARIGRWVLARLGDLRPEAARLARAVTVLGDGAPVSLASALADLDDTAGAETASLLVRTAILADECPLRFVHPIARAAIYQDVPRPQRALLHGRAAQLLARDPTGRDAAATHHLRSSASAQPEVVELLVNAAARAQARGAPDSAVAFLTRAMEEPPAAARRYEVLLALGEAQMRKGAAQEAGASLRGALDLAGDDEQQAAAAAGLGRSLAYQGRTAEAEDVIDASLRRIPDGPDAPDAPRLLLEATRLELQSSFDVNGTLTRLSRYGDLPGATRTERTLLIYLGYLRGIAGDRESGLGLIRRGLGSGLMSDPAGVHAEAWVPGVSALLWSDDFAEVEELTARGLEDARAHGAVLEFAAATTVACTTATFRGDLAAAEAHARTGLEAVSSASWRWALEARLGHVLALRGRIEEAEAQFEACRVRPHWGDVVSVVVLGHRGRLRFAQGRVPEGLEDLAAAVRFDDAMGWRSGGPFSPRHRLVLALAGRDRHRALQLAREDLENTRRHGVAGPIGVSEWCLGVAEGNETGIERIRQGVALLRRSPFRLHLAEALNDLGAALRRAGQRREARDHLREALELAISCGAELLVAGIADELRATGARPRTLAVRGSDALTPMERRVVDLAVQGRSNPEIAQALFVTRKNVEMHLLRSYSKLEIHSRTDLEAALARSSTPSEG